ncbi:hypothetical protein BBK82_13740 [Lentzea guizhouensis]|uniref:Polysaccharide biosynthesis protein n=2 Tax=Lentzea guizhouensis TaxID=1586287 RepID=A0A1B2HGX9_9PSEU|nr:hypothetical protein BBK82_13740 [Lentzea guizhouensis]
MAAGLGVFGLAGYLFVTLTGRTLTTGEALRATSFYFVVNVVGPGIFFALEQVTSRSVSAAVASGHALRPVVRKMCIGGAALTGAVMAGLLLLSPYLLPKTLFGDWGLFLGVLATPVILAALSIVRGTLGGLQRFSGYAATLMVEGGARIVVVTLLVFAHAPSAWIFGTGYLASSLVAVGAGLLFLRTAPSGGDQRVPGELPLLTKALTALAMASLLAQLLPNLAPLMVNSRLGDDSLVALAFAQAVVVARIPQLAFFPVQTMLLPALTAAVTRGDFGFVKRRILLTLGAVTVLGLIYSVLFVLVGSWVLRVFMATDTSTLTAWVMALLAFGTVVLIGVFAVQPALVAMGHDRTITTAWAIGTAATFGFALLPGDVPMMAAAAQVVGPALTLLVILVSFFRLTNVRRETQRTAVPGR